MNSEEEFLELFLLLELSASSAETENPEVAEEEDPEENVGIDCFKSTRSAIAKSHTWVNFMVMYLLPILVSARFIKSNLDFTRAVTPKPVM